MRILGTLARKLLGLPYAVRLGIVVGLFLVCTILLVFGFPSPYDGSLFSIPVALAAWLFKGRGASICIACITVLLVITYEARPNGLGPSSLVTVLLIGVLALSAEATVIAYLRYALDLVQNAQWKAYIAKQAELQAQMAYEYHQKLNQLKDDLLTHLGHELRTPLTSVGGYLELLRLQQGQLDTVMQAEFLGRAIESHEEVVGKVNTILNALSVTEDFPPAQCELLSAGQVVQEVIAHLDPAEIKTHHLKIQVVEPIQAWADRQFLREILQNLLSNAFKYAPPQSVVSIRATQQDLDSPVYICVQDQGPGIPPTERSQLFEKFARLKRDRFGSIPGNGLGLFICRQLVEAMQGRIWVESTGIAGEGSRFCFTLPPGRTL